MKFFAHCSCVVVLLSNVASAQTTPLIGAYAFSDGNAAGRFGAGLQFSGGSNGMPLPISGLSTGFTFESWINPSAQMLSDFWTQMPDWPTATPIYALTLTPSNTIAFSAYHDGAVYPMQTVQAVPMNQWTHVAITYDGVQLRIYFDAVEMARREAHGSLYETSQPMRIGSDFIGRIDEVRVYSRALTRAEIALDRATPVDAAEPFQVSVVTPADGALGIAATPITATFSAAAAPSTVSADTFQLRDGANAVVAAAVSYDETTRTALLTPSSPLAPLADYSATIGGTSWTFRTASASSGPRAAFSFSEGSGASAADVSGNGNVAALHHGASWAAGSVGGGVSFDGINDDVQLPASDTLAIADAFTFEAWVRPSEYAWGNIWSRYPDDTLNSLFDFGMSGTGTLYTSPVLSGTNYPMVTSVTLPVNAWSHVALTYDGVRLRIYVDGLEVASRLAHGSLAATPEPMEIGQWFHGAIDEVRIYDRALDPSEIVSDRQTPVDLPPPFLVTAVTPRNGASGVIDTPVSAAFSAGIDVTSLTTGTFELRDGAGALVSATFGYDALTRRATLVPDSPLSALTDYTARITSGVAAPGGNHLAGDVAWSFRTAAASTTPGAAYAFSEGSGGISDDWSGNGNTATLIHDAGWNSGWFGAGISFPAGNGGVRVQPSDAIALNGAFTFESWVLLTDYGWPQLWARQSDAQGGMPVYYLQTAPNGELDFNARVGDVDRPLRGAVIPLNTWTHVAATYDGAFVRLFLNGSEVASRTASGTLSVSNQPMEIGASTYGRVDEVRLYRRALSVAEIAADMATPVDTRRLRPAIANLAPSSGVAGQLITITGSNFGPVQPSSIVTFSGIAAVIDSWTDSSIVAIVPPGIASGSVVVTANGLASIPAGFTVVLPPAITSLSPEGGPAGQVVTVGGANFGAVQGNGGVTFNGVAAPIVSWSATSITANVPAAATTGPVVVSANGVVSNGWLFTVNGPRISAALSPQPNAFGWNSGTVTVTFTCTQTDSPLTFCTSAQTISFAGSGIKVTGRAIDQNGVTATMTVLLNIDLTGPAVNVYSPRATAVFPLGTASVMLKGSAVDLLSGAGLVTCAGMPATLVGQNFNCAVPVVDGTNSIQLVATDLAGRTATKTTSIVVADVAPATLTVTPLSLSMSAGDTHALAVVDDRGRTVSGGVWSSSAASVAVVSIDDDVPTVHASAAGTATLTLTRNGLSAQSTVTVFAADAMPADGTVLWSITPASNSQPGLTPGMREVVRAVPYGVPESSLFTPPSLFFVERGPYFSNQETTSQPTVIRAVTSDGREVWKYALPPDTTFGGYMPVRQVVPDDHGGLIVLSSSSHPVCCAFMNEVIRRFDAAGEVTWEYAHRETFGRFSEIALHPNGTVFVVEKLSDANSTELVAIDGLLGALVAKFDLTQGHSKFPNGSTATSPIVQDDGSIVTIVSQWDNVNLPTTPKSSYRATLPAATATSLVFEPLRHADGTPVILGVGDIMSGPWPDGYGGLVIGGISSLRQSGLATLLHIGADLVTSAIVELAFGTTSARDLQYVLGDDGAYVLVQYWEGAGTSGAKVYRLNPQTLGVSDVFDLSGGPYVQLTSAIAGGGTLYTSHQLGDAVQTGYGLLSGWNGNTPVMQTDTSVGTAETLWPSRRGAYARRHAPNMRYGISIKGQFVVIAPFIHTSLRVVPRNQARWANQPGFLSDALGTWFLTMGAESSTSSCGGDLVSDLNRLSDLNPDNPVYRQHLSYPADAEDRIIQTLLFSDVNYNDDLPYACRPTDVDIFYNSNSYTHGLMNKVGLPLPLAPELLPFVHWGWKKPVPSEEFDVR